MLQRCRLRSLLRLVKSCWAGSVVSRLPDRQPALNISRQVRIRRVGAFRADVHGTAAARAGARPGRLYVVVFSGHSCAAISRFS